MLRNTALEEIGKGPTRKQREIRKRARMLANAQSGTSRTTNTADPKAMETMKAFEAARKTLQAASGVVPTNAMTPVNTGDVLIIEVRGEKVNLRTGPGTEHSPVMQVAQGTRLTVESRQGEWLRVLTPTGGRAFVRNDLVVPLNQEVKRPQVPRAIGMSPRKPATQSIRKQTPLVPFGRVKVAGSPERDLEDAALNILKNMGKNSEKTQ